MGSSEGSVDVFAFPMALLGEAAVWLAGKNLLNFFTFHAE